MLTRQQLRDNALPAKDPSAAKYVFYQSLLLPSDEEIATKSNGDKEFFDEEAVKASNSLDLFESLGYDAEVLITNQKSPQKDSHHYWLGVEKRFFTDAIDVSQYTAVNAAQKKIADLERKIADLEKKLAAQKDQLARKTAKLDTSPAITELAAKIAADPKKRALFQLTFNPAAKG
jgi:hypothetical protein